MLVTGRLPLLLRRRIVRIWQDPSRPQPCTKCANPTFSSTNRSLAMSHKSEIEKQKNTFTEPTFPYGENLCSSVWFFLISCTWPCSKMMLLWPRVASCPVFDALILLVFCTKPPDPCLLFQCNLMLIGVRLKHKGIRLIHYCQPRGTGSLSSSVVGCVTAT